MKASPGATTPTPGEPGITAWSANQLSEAIHARKVSCREVMQAYLSRITAVNPKVNAIVSLQDETGLLAQADARDAQLARGESMGWMHGMPHAVKDTANAAGLPATIGSPLLRNFVPQQDGLMAGRLRAAGALFIGKTNVPEFGLGSHSFNEVFGVTRNPFDISKTAGGSSGGAAVALAARLLPVADGSDFQGSLRNPAGWNNVFGFRPSTGRVPMWPASDVFISQMGTEGPMARTVDDLARLLHIQAGPDPRQPFSINGSENFEDNPRLLDTRRVKIGWLGDMGGHLAMEDGVLPVCEEALKRFEGLGCGVEPAQLEGEPEQVWRDWLVWRSALMATRIAPFLTKPENRVLIKPEALWEYEQSAALTARALMAASARRTEFYQRISKLLQTHDFLALPSAQVWPFDAAMRWPQDIRSAKGVRTMDTYHRWMEVTIYATYAGLPCLSIPAGFNAQGLPMGLQIIGRPQADAEVLQLARAYERVAQDVLMRQPNLNC